MDNLGRNLENESKIKICTHKTPFLGPNILRALIHFYIIGKKTIESHWYAPALYIFVGSNFNLIFAPRPPI
jgi:hypothetical protein